MIDLELAGIPRPARVRVKRVHLIPYLVYRVLPEPVKTVQLPLKVVSLVFLLPHERVKTAEGIGGVPVFTFEDTLIDLNPTVLFVQ